MQILVYIYFNFFDNGVRLSSQSLFNVFSENNNINKKVKIIPSRSINTKG